MYFTQSVFHPKDLYTTTGIWNSCTWPERYLPCKQRTHANQK